MLLLCQSFFEAYSIHSCCSSIIALIAVVIYLPLADFFSLTLTLFTALCSSVVNKGFLLFLISSALPPSTFCLWKPWFVVRSLQLEPGWPAPSLASKPAADEKFMTVCLENLTFHLKCCCSSDAAPTDGDRVCRLHSTSAFPHSGSANQGERVGRCPWLYTPSLVFTNQGQIFLGCVQ